MNFNTLKRSSKIKFSNFLYFLFIYIENESKSRLKAYNQSLIIMSRVSFDRHINILICENKKKFKNSQK